MYNFIFITIYYLFSWLATVTPVYHIVDSPNKIMSLING